MMFRNRSVDVHQFAMVPRAEIPRAAFKIEHALKTTFDAGLLIPIYCEEVLPGDHVSCRATLFGRLATPLFPLMDNLHVETFFFFVPNRLVWANWKKFMGEQTNPGDSISFTVPVIQTPGGGWQVNSIGDYFGLPTLGQLTGGGWISHSELPLRGYNLIYNEWFRSEDLINSKVVDTSDGPGNLANYGGAPFTPYRRTKRHDYFTSALPWPQKGGTSVSIPLGTQAVVKTSSTNLFTGAQTQLQMLTTAGAVPGINSQIAIGAATGTVGSGGGASTPTVSLYPANLYADLSTATAATINQLRQSFQIQKLLERDARGGTRYTEIVRSHFGVVSPDARLQRPEYLGGGSAPLVVNPVAQTGQTGLTGGSTPLGTLAGIGTTLAHGHGFNYASTEHGYIIGLVNVRGDIAYQQGIRKHWLRSTRYDFYFPVFAALGEQAIQNQEIYVVGSNVGAGQTAQDLATFGYQERWAEYRYHPSEITGLFRSTSAGTIDPWHLAQKFTALPTLGQTFIEENPPLSRNLAVGAAANGQQIIMDCFFSARWARPMPLYSVPGLIDHF